MKLRTALSIGLLLALSACNSGEQTITSDMVIRAPDTAKAAQLLKDTENVIIRRLAGADIQDAKATAIVTSSGSATLTVRVKGVAAAEKTKQILASPFVFDIRLEKLAEKTEDPSEWIATSITNDSLNWIQPLGDPATGQISLELQFTEKGREALASTFKGNKGKNIGIFVRDLLISKLKIDNEEIANRIIISGIPSGKVAEIFADDVNVGLHVTFTTIR